MTAVCVRCGAGKAHYTHVCAACGNRPDGEGLLVAWIASTEHLRPELLAGLGERIASGEPLRPSPAMLAAARRALGREISTGTSLTGLQRLGIFVGSLVLTPLLGFTCFVWWRTEHPLAAWQALGLSLPPAVLGGAVWLYALMNGVAA